MTSGIVFLWSGVGIFARVTPIMEDSSFHAHLDDNSMHSYFIHSGLEQAPFFF